MNSQIIQEHFEFTLFNTVGLLFLTFLVLYQFYPKFRVMIGSKIRSLDDYINEKRGIK